MLGLAYPRDQAPGLYVLDREETTPHRLADIQVDGRFVWSPDSRKIAFMQHAPNDGTSYDYALCAFDVGCQQVRLLAKDINMGGVLRPDWPSWSPESQQVAYTSNAEGKDNIYTIAVDGASRRCLTEETPDNFQISHLAWPPNSI